MKTNSSESFSKPQSKEQIRKEIETGVDDYKIPKTGEDEEHYGVNQPKFFRDTFTLVAKDDEEIIGYVTVIIDSGVAQIEPLMVAIDRKEQGIGNVFTQVY